MNHRNFYLNIVWQYVLQAVKYLFPLLTLPYLTRVLEPEGYAIYAYIISFMSFVQTFIDFGFNLSGTKDVAKASDQNELSEILGSVTQARLFLSVLAGIACLLLGVGIPLIRDNALYAILAYVAVCGRALAPDFLFQGKERMSPITLRYFLSKGLSTVLTFVVVRKPGDLIWVPVLDIIASTIALLWSLASAKRLFGAKLQLVPYARVVKDLRTSAYYCLSNMSSIVFSGFTTLLIGIVIVDQEQISYWSLAFTAISAVQSLYNPIINSLYPHMLSQGDYRFAKQLALISIPFVAGGTLLFVALSDWIVMLLGGELYLPGAYVLRLLSPVLLFSFYGMLFGWPVLGSLGKVKELTTTTVLSALTNIVLLLLLSIAGHASIGSFAIVRSFTELLMCVLRTTACQRVLRSTSMKKP